MIKKIDKDELMHSFYDLVTEVEFGSHFDKTNPYHVEVLDYRINNHITRGCEFFGYYEENKNIPVGFITSVIYKDIQPYRECEILQIGVKKESRNSGCGSILLNFVETYYEKENINYIFVKTYAASYGVTYFYGKNGYIPVSVIPNTHTLNDEGTIIMRKKLIK